MSVLLRGSASICVGIERASRGWRRHGSPPRPRRSRRQRVAARSGRRGGPVRRGVLASNRPTCSVTTPRAEVGLFSDAYRRQTGPPLAECRDRSGRTRTPTHSVRKQARLPQRRRTTSQRNEQPTPLTPLGADGLRRHPDQRPSGTPKRTRHPSARNTPPKPRDQRPRRQSRAVRHPPTSDATGPLRPPQSCRCCRFAAGLQHGPPALTLPASRPRCRCRTPRRSCGPVGWRPPCCAGPLSVESAHHVRPPGC